MTSCKVKSLYKMHSNYVHRCDAIIDRIIKKFNAEYCWDTIKENSLKKADNVFQKAIKVQAGGEVVCGSLKCSRIE